MAEPIVARGQHRPAPGLALRPDARPRSGHGAPGAGRWGLPDPDAGQGAAAW